MRLHATSSSRLLTAAALALLSPLVHAQASDPRAVAFARNAINAEFASDANDHSPWIYRDHDVQPGRDSVMINVDTPEGSLRRTIELNGRKLVGQQEAGETARIDRYIADTSDQARQRKNDAHDDEQAAAILRMLPDAFIWTIHSQTPQFTTLDYRPNPAFNPSGIDARVMSQMAGQMVITHSGDKIWSLRGRLLNDVKIGFGLVHLRAGGTFDVERREIAPGHWQVVEQHTHIDGHALLFKTISEQEDEIKTDFKPSPARTLAEAARILGAGH